MTNQTVGSWLRRFLFYPEVIARAEHRRRPGRSRDGLQIWPLAEIA